MDHSQFCRHVESAMNVADGSIDPTSRFQELQAWDSVAALMVIAVIDREYGVVLDASKLVECQTVGELANVVEQGANAQKA